MEASCKTYTSNYLKLLAKLSLLLTGSFLQIFPFYLLIAPCRIFPPTYWKLLAELPCVTSFLHFIAFTCPTLAVSIAWADLPTTWWDTGSARSSTITCIACPIWLALALATYTSAMVRTRTQQTIGIITGEVVTLTVLTRDHLEEGRKKKERKKKFFLCYYLFYLAKVFPLWNEVSSYVYNFNSIIKFQPQHTAQPMTYDQPTFSSIRSHSPSVSNYHLTVKNHLRPLANYNRSRAVFHCCWHSQIAWNRSKNNTNLYYMTE